jgi:hypothetical protein
MAEFDTKKREKLRSTQFAYVDSKGGEHQEGTARRPQGLSMEEGSPSGGKPLEAAAADQLFCSWYDSLMCSY